MIDFTLEQLDAYEERARYYAEKEHVPVLGEGLLRLCRMARRAHEAEAVRVERDQSRAAFARTMADLCRARAELEAATTELGIVRRSCETAQAEVERLTRERDNLLEQLSIALQTLEMERRTPPPVVSGTELMLIADNGDKNRRQHAAARKRRSGKAAKP